VKKAAARKGAGKKDAAAIKKRETAEAAAKANKVTAAQDDVSRSLDTDLLNTESTLEHTLENTEPVTESAPPSSLGTRDVEPAEISEVKHRVVSGVEQYGRDDVGTIENEEINRVEHTFEANPELQASPAMIRKNVLAETIEDEQLSRIEKKVLVDSQLEAVSPMPQHSELPETIEDEEVDRVGNKGEAHSEPEASPNTIQKPDLVKEEPIQQIEEDEIAEQANNKEAQAAAEQESRTTTAKYGKIPEEEEEDELAASKITESLQAPDAFEESSITARPSRRRVAPTKLGDDYPSSSKTTTATSRRKPQPVRGNWSAEHLLTNPKSKLVTCNLPVRPTLLHSPQIKL